MGATKVNIGKKSGLLENTEKFTFILQPVANNRHLHIYSTLPHQEMQSIHGYGKLLSSKLQCTPSSWFGSKSDHVHTINELCQGGNEPQLDLNIAGVKICLVKRATPLILGVKKNKHKKKNTRCKQRDIYIFLKGMSCSFYDERNDPLSTKLVFVPGCKHALHCCKTGHF